MQNKERWPDLTFAVEHSGMVEISYPGGHCAVWPASVEAQADRTQEQVSLEQLSPYLSKVQRNVKMDMALEALAELGICEDDPEE